MLSVLRGAVVFGAAMIIATSPTMAATATGNLTVRITIQAQCVITSAADLDFGTQGVITTTLIPTTTIGVQCTAGQTYNIGLSAGAGSGATTALRYMTGPASAVIGYSLYRDNLRSLPWGVTIGTDTVSDTGTGSVRNATVYGEVKAQTTPAPGVYTDTVAITVTY